MKSPPPWFPRPALEGDVVLLQPFGTWSVNAVLEALGDPSVVELREKVGVAGALDGSGRTSTRLLSVKGLIFKTRLDQAFGSSEEALLGIAHSRTLGRRARIWHPSKLWVLIRDPIADVWRPMTICEELVTLRQAPTLEERLLGWAEMLQAGLDAFRLHGIGLDINPSNFARGPSAERGTLFYIDEDIYESLHARHIAGALMSRIAEEPRATIDDWQIFAATLRDRLVLGPITWEDIEREIRCYPLPVRYEEIRDGILHAIGSGDRKHEPEQADRYEASGARKEKRDVVCVIADVHGNLPALEAVLADAEREGATSYLFLGDAVGYGPFPVECIERLATLKPLTAVRGNHDAAVATGEEQFHDGMSALARECARWTCTQVREDDRVWLGTLPRDHFGDGWLAVHGAPKDPKRFIAYVYELTYEDNLRYLQRERIAICFCGHTHVQLTYVELAAGPSKLAGPRSFRANPPGPWLVNPGSVGQPRDGDPRAAYALWNRSSGDIVTKRVAYDIERTIQAIRRAGLPAQLEERLRTGA